MACSGTPGLLQIGDNTARRISNVLSNGVSVNSFPSFIASLLDNQFVNVEIFQLEHEK
jgi:hypothetical protein